MKFFLDSADIVEIKRIKQIGMIDGITTNPSLFSKTTQNFRSVVLEICKIIEHDISIEIVASNYDDMLIQGERLLDISSQIVLKIPITVDGLRACKYFSSHGKDVNMTLCFSVAQALFAAKAGAKYISPFIGRLNDIGQDGIQLVREIKSVFENYKYTFSTQILGASIRNISDVLECAKIGVDAVTISGKIFDLLSAHPLTSEGLKRFEEDWKRSGLKI